MAEEEVIVLAVLRQELSAGHVAAQGLVRLRLADLPDGEEPAHADVGIALGRGGVNGGLLRDGEERAFRRVRGQVRIEQPRDARRDRQRIAAVFQLDVQRVVQIAHPDRQLVDADEVLRRQRIPSVGDDAVHHDPVHGLIGPVGDLGGVGVVQQEHPHAPEALAHALGHAVEHRGGLLAGHEVVRAKAAVAVALGDAEARRPGRRLRDAAVRSDVDKRGVGLLRRARRFVGVVKPHDHVAAGGEAVIRRNFLCEGGGAEGQRQHQRQRGGQKLSACLLHVHFLLSGFGQFAMTGVQ